MYKILFFSFFFSSLSFGGTIQCGGTVEKIGLHANNRILLKLSSMNTKVFICTIDAEWTVSGTSYKTSAETCKAMLSMLMHAKATKADMGAVWFDGDDVPESCNGWLEWKTTNVRHFMY
ncbi:MAG: hypothetical protein HRT38_01755 [Alteromonadaceae bacterium]|nr:hypothetical protein [Alteromonadaceae bacterium]